MIDVIITILCAAIVICVWIVLYETTHFTIRQEKIVDHRIKEKARAVVIADLHNKQYGKDNEKLIDAIKKSNPDFIFIAGDLMTARPGRDFSPAISLLEAIKDICPICYGNGNHEHRIKLDKKTYGDMAEAYGRELDRIGVKQLVNDSVYFEKYNIRVYGSEINRFYYRRFKQFAMPCMYMDSILGKPNQDEFNVLLAHNPAYFSAYAEWGAELVLSGHVHGGVIQLPFMKKGVIAPSLKLFPKYDSGIFHKQNSEMILSTGLGVHTIPIRLFNPAELWIVDFYPEEKE